MTNSNIRMEAPQFVGLLKQNGGLLPDMPEAHALWHYYITAIETWQARYVNQRYSAESQKHPNFKNIARSIALLHQVDMERMLNLWDVVEKQAIKMMLVPPPMDKRFRINVILQPSVLLN